MCANTIKEKARRAGLFTYTFTLGYTASDKRSDVNLTQVETHQLYHEIHIAIIGNVNRHDQVAAQCADKNLLIRRIGRGIVSGEVGKPALFCIGGYVRNDTYIQQVP